MRRKRCQFCHEFYKPDPRTYRQQKTCTKSRCRAARRSHAVKRWKLHHKYHAQGDSHKQKQWRERHKGYWKQWRAKHPGYVRRNRRKQRGRNARNRTLIAKGNEIELICVENLRQISLLRLIAKRNEWHKILFLQIDELCRYLQRQLLIAKGNDMDLAAAGMG